MLTPMTCLIAACLMLTPMARADQPADATTKPAEKAAAPSADTSPLVTEAIINAPVDEVWKVFSTPEGYKKFGVALCEMDFRPGGLIRSRYQANGTLDDDGAIHNQIMSYEPGRTIAFRIVKPPKGFPFMEAYKSMWSVATLTDLGDGRTHLRLTQVGYTADEESQKMRAFFKAGNDWSLRKLQASFDASATGQVPAKVHVEGDFDPLTVESLVPLNRADVWTLLSTSAGWKSFMGVETNIDPRPEGPFEIYFSMQAPKGERGSEGCTVLSVLPGRMLSFSWNAPPTMAFARSQHTWVVVELEDVSATSTRVRLTQMGFDALAKAHAEHADEFKQCRAYFKNAWPKVLGALAQAKPLVAKARE